MILKQIIYWSIVFGIGFGMVATADSRFVHRLFCAFLRRMR